MSAEAIGNWLSARRGHVFQADRRLSTRSTTARQSHGGEGSGQKVTCPWEAKSIKEPENVSQARNIEK